MHFLLEQHSFGVIDHPREGLVIWHRYRMGGTQAHDARSENSSGASLFSKDGAGVSHGQVWLGVHLVTVI